MSDHYIHIISRDPFYSPPDEVAEQVLTLLRKRYKRAEQITCEYFAGPQFIACGENFTAVFCPYCGEPLTDWWRAEMDRLHQPAAGFAQLYTKTPCCGITTSLCDLHYRWPCGLAKAKITLKNAADLIPPALLHDLAQIMATPLSLVYQHV